MAMMPYSETQSCPHWGPRRHIWADGLCSGADSLQENADVLSCAQLHLWSILGGWAKLQPQPLRQGWTHHWWWHHSGNWLLWRTSLLYRMGKHEMMKWTVNKWKVNTSFKFSPSSSHWVSQTLTWLGITVVVIVVNIYWGLTLCQALC